MKEKAIKTVLLLLCFCFCLQAGAQRLSQNSRHLDDMDDELNTNVDGWGVKAGVNFSNIFGLGDINTSNRAGFHAGFLYKKPLLSKMAFMPELVFSRRVMHFRTPGSVVRNRLSMDYLDFPMLFVFYPLDNVTLHLGPQGSLLLGIRENKNRVSTAGFNRFELGAAGGIEFKVYALRLGARYNLGLRNLLDNSEAHENQIFSQESGWNEENFRNASIQAYVAVHLRTPRPVINPIE